MSIGRSWVWFALGVVAMAIAAFFGEMLLHDASDWLILAVAVGVGFVVGGLVRLARRLSEGPSGSREAP